MNINASLSISESTVSDFEMRGVTLRLFQAIRKYALSLNSEKEYWNMGRISALIIGNHEILKENNRWGNVDPESTLTYGDRCSLVDVLERRYSTGGATLRDDHAATLTTKNNLGDLIQCSRDIR